MGLFTKNKKAVPAIPMNTTPTSPPTPSISVPSPEAPTNNPIKEMPQPSVNIPTPTPSPSPTTESQTLPQPSLNPSITERDNIPTVTKELKHKQEAGITAEKQPFFVRIDKFSETKENFEKVNEKIQEMERIIHNLEITKKEEEEEIEEWKKDVIEMKSYLSEIDKEIFNKI